MSSLWRWGYVTSAYHPVYWMEDRCIDAEFFKMVSKGPLSDPVHWWDNWHVMKQLFDATLLLHTSQKSDNLHYNTLYCLVDLIDAPDVPSIIFFHNLLQTQNSKMKGFLQRIYKKLWNKNDTFTIRRWVVCPSNPATHRVILKIVGFLVQRRYTSEREIPEGCHLWVTKI